MKIESGAQEILRQWEAFGWTMLAVLVTIIIAVFVLDEIEKRRGEH